MRPVIAAFYAGSNLVPLTLRPQEMVSQWFNNLDYSLLTISSSSFAVVLTGTCGAYNTTPGSRRENSIRKPWQARSPHATLPASQPKDAHVELKAVQTSTYASFQLESSTVNYNAPRSSVRLLALGRNALGKKVSTPDPSKTQFHAGFREPQGPVTSCICWGPPYTHAWVSGSTMCCLHCCTTWRVRGSNEAHLPHKSDGRFDISMGANP